MSINDLEKNNEPENLIQQESRLKTLQRLISNHPVIAAISFFFFSVVPLLTFFGLPDTGAKICDTFIGYFNKHETIITPKFSKVLQPNQIVTLKVTKSQENEKDWIVKKEQKTKDIVFTISCKGEIGDPISFKVLTTNCPDNPFDFRLGDISDVEVYCP